MSATGLFGVEAEGRPRSINRSCLVGNVRDIRTHVSGIKSATSVE